MGAVTVAGDLPRRLLTAAVGLPLVWAVATVGGAFFAATLALVCAVATWELCRLAGAHRAVTMLACALGVGLLAIAVNAGAGPTLVALGACATPATALALAMRRRAPDATHPDVATRQLLVVLATLVWVALPLAVLALLHAGGGAGWVALALSVTWGADAGACLVGRRFGRTPLTSVSPRKTREGALAGLLTALLGAALVRALWLPDLDPLLCLVIAAAANAAGQLGDLGASLLKRAAGAKDSGRIVPGYGGVLDKVDSLLLAAPLLYGFHCFLT